MTTQNFTSTSSLLQKMLITMFRYYTRTIKRFTFPFFGGELSKMSSKISNMVNDTVMGVLGVVIFLLIGVALDPTVIAAVVGINTTILEGVPLASVIILLAEYLPAFYYLALVLGAMVGIWAAVHYTKG